MRSENQFVSLDNYRECVLVKQGNCKIYFECWRGVPNGKVPAWKAGARKGLQVRVLSPPPKLKMDLYIHTNINECKQLLNDARFDISNKGNYFNARLQTKWGRYDCHFLPLGEEIYLDFHYDYYFHFMFLGVDYRNRPRSFFINKLEPLLRSRQMAYRIKESNWFHRHNKAILW